jgi:poly-gamma-glutamate synthesis protein (capsule biosynthesis protein)
MRLALAGDTMLGRGVAEKLAEAPPESLFADEIVDQLQHADLFVLNLECCISERGEPWPVAGKPFFFRAPPAAVDTLRYLGTDCVTLANNHALDFGREALLDTIGHLEDGGIKWVGAGATVEEARRPALLQSDGFRLEVVATSDHPEDFAAGSDIPGIAHADLRRSVPSWILDAVRTSAADAVLVTPHWGPNMVAEPRPEIRAAAKTLCDAGATIVAGHSAHVFHGVEGQVLYDLGDFVDDYAVDPVLRNDLGLLFFAEIDDEGIVGVEALPLKLDYCFTRPAEGDDRQWIATRFSAACEVLGAVVEDIDGKLHVKGAGGNGV